MMHLKSLHLCHVCVRFKCERNQALKICTLIPLWRYSSPQGETGKATGGPETRPQRRHVGHEPNPALSPAPAGGLAAGG